MSLDKLFAASVLQGGKDIVRFALDHGIGDDYLMGDGLKVWKYVRDYWKQYQDVPTFDQVEGRTGVKLDPLDPGIPADYYALEVLNRKLHGAIGAQLAAVESLHAAMDVQGAYEEYESGLRELRKLGIATSKTVSLLALAPDFLDYYDKLKSGYRGIQTPWPTVNEATLGFWPEDFILYVARMGIGKCVTADSEIVDPSTGIPYTIATFYEREGLREVPTWDQTGVHSAPLTAKVDTGTKECLRFKLGTGRSIGVTPEHPFLTPEGWQRADALKSGMSVAVPARMPLPEEPISPPLEEVVALAILLAEGSYSGEHVGFSSEDPEIVRLAESVAEFYKVDLKYRSGVDYDFVRRERYGPNNVRTLLRSLGMDGKKAVEKTIPAPIFRLGPDALAWFLTIFWMCDGYVTDNGAEIVLGSERMLRQIQSLLLRFGVQSRVSEKPTKYNGTIREAWRLRVLASGYERLSMVLGLWGKKKDNLNALARRRRNPNVGSPHISEGFAQKLRNLAATRAGRWCGGALKEVGKKLGRSRFETKHLFGANSTLLLTPFKAFCEVYGVEDEYRWLWDSDLFWDTVEEIAPIGEQKVYDLTVQPSECFVANDILVHNTWALTILANYAWAVEKKRVLFITTEMGREKILQRWVAVHFKYPYNELRKAQLSAFAEQNMRDKLQGMMTEEGLYIIGGDFDFRIESLEGAIDECEPDIVLVDGAYLLKVKGEGRVERAANSFDELKRTAKRCHIPLVASTQFNRQVKSNNLSSVGPEKIALSDAAGWNADLIYGLVRTDDMIKDKRMIQLQLKFREGEGEDIETHWDFDTMNFDELPQGAQAPLGPPGGAGGATATGGGSGGSGGGSGPSGSSQPDPFSSDPLFGGDDGKDPVPF